MMITGHTHRPRFPDKQEIRFFNKGGFTNPRSIKAIEIENKEINLIKTAYYYSRKRNYANYKKPFRKP